MRIGVHSPRFSIVRFIQLQIISVIYSMAPQERLPDDGPWPIFFLPNLLGTLLAYALERYRVEAALRNNLGKEEAHHPHALLGLGVLALALTNSYLSGSVVKARVRYNVKLPNLYAFKSSNKNAVLFNCIQRGHQNFLEQLPLIVLSVFYMCYGVDRTNTAGVLLLLISFARILYAVGYRSDNVRNRLGPILISFFCTSIGIGYGALSALSLLGGVNLLAEE